MSPLPHTIPLVHWRTWNIFGRDQWGFFVFIQYNINILLYGDNVILLSKPWACLQRLLNELYEHCTSFSLGVNSFKTKSMIFGHNKRKLNQEAFYLDKDRIEITHEYKYFGIASYSHGYFEPSSKRQRIVGMKALMGTLRKEVVVGVKLKSYLFKALVLHTFTYGIEIWEATWRTLIWRFSRRPWRCIWYLTSKCVLWLPIVFCWPNLENFP